MSKRALKGKMPTVFIDGEAGTTGLQIRERLDARRDIALASVPTAHRKDPEARKAVMADADVVILCLPDDAAKDSVALGESLGNQRPRFIDASSAHRVAAGWTYGFAELSKDQARLIANAANVSNPGCYPTGGIALIRPLIDAGLMAADHKVMINAVSGYSGGGKAMIEAYETGKAPNFELYGLGFAHKHLPELKLYAGLAREPVFVPSVGNFRQGMLVSVPLSFDALKGVSSGAILRDCLAAHYQGSEFVRVAGAEETAALKGKLEPEALNNTNKMELFVFESDAKGQAVLVARLDNLGKGASGAAVQNLELMLGM